ncbi:TlpA family protein disulfide reductase [Rubripirellula reticaptiva]|uniref:Thiol-disulfide oxidoreductase ResA n=1 Tax=Rubripirellula reticaptiva TaxID=2528013 RepID=A0A5C6EXR7_9BACT|nr:TlpA family protein disulfide reductase [Rubripirellula reticaptiva]TWU52011.1 Thiol-disulfide oxidoreductase ResA [Rubripirellula reticaptiva]
MSNADSSRTKSVPIWILLLATIVVCSVGTLAFVFVHLTPPLDPVTQQRLNASQRELEEMVGKPASPLLGGQWIGGTKPVVSDKPQLLFFWATWCSACEPYLIELQDLVGDDAVIIGMHPAGTDPLEVERAIQRMQLRYPTFLANDERGPTAPIANYPVTFFPYSILVNSDGTVVSHGAGFKETKAKLLMTSQQARESGR